MFRLLVCFTLIGTVFACAPKCLASDHTHHWHDSHTDFHHFNHTHCHCGPFSVDGAMKTTTTGSGCGTVSILCPNAAMLLRFDGKPAGGIKTGMGSATCNIATGMCETTEPNVDKIVTVAECKNA